MTAMKNIRAKSEKLLKYATENTWAIENTEWVISFCFLDILLKKAVEIIQSNKHYIPFFKKKE